MSTVSESSADQLLQDGIVAAKTGDKSAADTLIRKATRLDPENELAWLWLASVVSSPAEQIDCLERVLDINPLQDQARNALCAARMQAGLSAAEAGNPAEARAHLRAVVALDSEQELAWFWLASVAENPAEAERALQRVLLINPDNHRAAESLKAYQKESTPARNAPQSSPSPNALAWQCPYCTAQAEKLPDRCPACHAVLSLAQLDALLSNDQVSRDVLSPALAKLEAQMRGRPDFQAYLYLGLGYANLRVFDQAQKFLQAAQRQRPADPVLRSQIAAFLRKRESAEIAAKIETSKKLQVQIPTVLVVDQNPTIRAMIGETLEPRGYRVLQAGDGHEAVDMLRRGGTPDLMFVAVRLPGLGGYELCKLIRQHPETRRIPVVMLCDKEGLFDRIRGQLAGSSCLLPKPLKAEHLIQVAAGLVKK